MERYRKQIMFTMAEEVSQMLQVLADNENRNRSNMIETLILQEYQKYMLEQKKDPST